MTGPSRQEALPRAQGRAVEKVGRERPRRARVRRVVRPLHAAAHVGRGAGGARVPVELGRSPPPAPTCPPPPPPTHPPHTRSAAAAAAAASPSTFPADCAPPGNDEITHAKLCFGLASAFLSQPTSHTRPYSSACNCRATSRFGRVLRLREGLRAGKYGGKALAPGPFPIANNSVEVRAPAGIHLPCEIVS
jgi:hypothetical protein